MPHGDILGFSPPLVMTRSEVDEVIDLAAAAVREVSDELVREESISLAQGAPGGISEG